MSGLWGTSALIGREKFLLVSWCGFCVATVCFIGRIVVRLSVFKRLGLDDLFVFLAWGSTTAFSIEWHIKSAKLWTAIAQTAGKVPMDGTFLDVLYEYLSAQTGAIICTNLGLWFIKFSLLCFFRKLGGQIRHQKILWWVVTAYVSIGLPITLAVAPWKYHDLQNVRKVLVECSSPGVGWFTMNALKVHVAIDITTDTAILTIPFAVLWQVRLSIWRKLALASLFGLTLLVMLCCILRVVIVEETAFDIYIDVSWLYLWYKIELDTAIIVACLASFQALYTPQRACHVENYRVEPLQLLRNRTCPGLESWDTQVESRVLKSDEVCVTKNVSPSMINSAGSLGVV